MSWIELSTQTFMIPCRRFSAQLTVSRSKRLPIVKEFTLRLVKTLDVCRIEVLSGFFDFTSRELSVLLGDLEASNLVQTDNREIRLTNEAVTLFSAIDSDGFMVSQIEEWDEQFAIDFISFSLINFGKSPKSKRAFHQLRSVDEEKASRATRVAAEVFTNSFFEYVDKYKRISRNERENISMYGLSAINANQRFAYPLTVVFVMDSENPSDIRAQAPLFKNESGTDQRPELVSEVWNRLTQAQERSKFGTTPHALFCDELGDPFYQGIWADAGSDLDRLRAGFGNQHSLTKYDDGRSVAVFGDFSIEANGALLKQMLEEAVEEREQDLAFDVRTLPRDLFIQKPSNGLWGRSQSCFDSYNDLKTRLTKISGNRARAGLIVNARYEDIQQLKWRLSLSHSRYIFERCLKLNFPQGMSSVEAVVVPGLLCGVIYHFFDPASMNCVVPFGFVSRDPKRIAEVTRLLHQSWAGYGRVVHEVWLSGDGAAGNTVDIFRQLKETAAKRRLSPTTLTLKGQG